jgi:DNA-binding NtrC family response regulator
MNLRSSALTSISNFYRLIFFVARRERGKGCSLQVKITYSVIGHRLAMYPDKMLSTSHPQPAKLADTPDPTNVPTGASVLILDGDVRLRAALNATFLRYGWQVKTAATFREAARFISHQRVDLVISDLVMSDGSVLEVITALQTYVPMTPVIVLAAHASVAEVVQVMRAGAFDVLARNSAVEVLQRSAMRAVEAFGGRGNSFSGISAAGEFPVSPIAAEGRTLSELNRRHLEDALIQAEGNRTNAAKVLGISVRTVRNKIRQYGLPPRT